MNALVYFFKLARYAFRTTPVWYLSIALSLTSVATELLAMASLFPLTSVASGQSLPEGSRFIHVLRAVGLIPDMPTLLCIFLALFSLRIATQAISLGLASYLARSLQAKMSAHAFKVFVSDYSLAELDRRNVGYFIQLAGDESSRASTVLSTASMFISHAALAVLYFAAIVHYSVPTALGVSAFLFLCFLSLIGIFRKSHRLGMRMVEESRVSSSIFLDGLNGLRAVRAFTAENYVATRYSDAIHAYVRTIFWSEYLTSVARSVPMLLLLGSLFWIVILKADTLQSELNLAFVMTVLVFLMRFFPAVGQCLTTFMRVVSESKSGTDITNVLEYPTRVATGDRRASEDVFSIALNDLGFSYDGRQPVLAGVNATFERGKSYALIGPSGSGKSTLLDLLLKFYAPNCGRILLNESSLDILDEQAVRQHVLLLGQETTIFNDTIYNNVTFGLPATQSQVEEACRLACIHDDILSFPQGYQTPLTYRGANLSGGQRQRIGIARALLRNANVLVMDESTSALDQETRSRVVENILSRYHDRIVIFVTHDSYLIERADVRIDLLAINLAPRHAVPSGPDHDPIAS